MIALARLQAFTKTVGTRPERSVLSTLQEKSPSVRVGL